MSAPAATRRTASHYRGCLLGGAVGDAVGAAVEFHAWPDIVAQFGAAGVVRPEAAYGRVGAITDDTQMTLFTAEGLLRARTRWEAQGICHVPSVVYTAYLRWLYTQGFGTAATYQPLDGWLVGVRGLSQKRAPGRTCVTALRHGKMGTIEDRLNESKGCGGVMRMAPVGLVTGTAPFRLGCELAALTHGHPSGYLSAGCLAHIIFRLVEGDLLSDAIMSAREELARWKDHVETDEFLERAVGLAIDGGASMSAVESLGGGWTGESALAIAVYCALAADRDFARGVLLAANHSGDSDSTAAITGNILGAQSGVEAIPEEWLAVLELRDVVTAVADDLLTGYREAPQWLERYPGH